jgi:folate-binding protein YgfZ
MYLYHFNNAIFFKASGKDALRYLNARLSNDIRKTTINRATLAACLTPQGRAQGLFIIINNAPNEYLLVCDGGNSEEVESALKKYIVADRIEVTNLTQELSFLHLSDSEQKPIPGLGKEEFASAILDNTIYIRHKRLSQNGLDLIVPGSILSETKEQFKSTGFKEINFKEYTLLRMQSGAASFPEDINDSYIFSAYNLNNAVVPNKGCYVGQEVIEKIDSYAHLPYLIKAAKFNGNIYNTASEEKISITDKSKRKVGKIVSTCYDYNSKQTFSFIEIKNDPQILNSEFFAQDILGKLL